MNGADLLVVILVVMLVLLVVVMVVMPYLIVLVIFGFRKKCKGLDDLFLLLPLNLRGPLRESPKKSTTANTNGGYRFCR